MKDEDHKHNREEIDNVAPSFSSLTDEQRRTWRTRRVPTLATPLMMTTAMMASDDGNDNKENDKSMQRHYHPPTPSWGR